MKEKIGIIGLGNIGGAVAKHCISLNNSVSVYDVDSNKVNEFVSYGASGMNSIKELVFNVNYLITSLPNDFILKKVLLENKEVFTALSSNVILIELSTVLPDTLEEIETAFANANIEILDCPISGGPEEAKKGELSLIVSGKREVFEKSQKILNDIGNTVHYVSEKIGEAKAIKLINNIMTMGNVLVAAEAFSFGIKYGINPKLLYSVLSQTGGNSHHFKKRFPKVIEDDYSPWFSLELGKKDLDLAKKWTNINDYSNRITSFVDEYYGSAVNNGLKDEDIVAIIKLFLNK